jgi:hypothetical protein
MADSAAGAIAAPMVAWRERFRTQVALAAAGLVAAALLVVLVVQVQQPRPCRRRPGERIRRRPRSKIRRRRCRPISRRRCRRRVARSAPSLDEVMAQSSGRTRARLLRADAAAGCRRVHVGERRCSAAPVPRGRLDRDGVCAGAEGARRAERGAIRVTTVGLYGCRFTDVLVQNDDPAVMQACTQRKNDVAAMIAADHPEQVLVSNAYTLGRTADGRDLSAADLIAAEAAEMARYGMPGRIVYLEAPPEGAPLGNCYTRVGSPYACATSITPVWRDMQAATAAAAAASGDRLVDALAFTCWQDVCPAFAGTLPIRYDQTHLTVAYSAHLAPYLRWALDGAVAAGAPAPPG